MINVTSLPGGSNLNCKSSVPEVKFISPIMYPREGKYLPMGILDIKGIINLITMDKE
jgi:hypothetical protein